MVEKAKEKARARAKRRRERLISSFVMISIVLSVLFVASVATVSAVDPPPPPPSCDDIIVTADPTWLPADEFSRSTITATVINGTEGADMVVYFDIINQPSGCGAALTNDSDIIYSYSGTNNTATVELTAGVEPGDVTIKADCLGEMNTTTVELIPTPTIIDWYNNKTGSSLSVTISESECVYFNATADQPIDTWRWFVDDVNQTHNFDDFTYCGWGVNGTYYVKVNGTNNVNGTSNMVTWTVTVNDITPPAKVEGLTNSTPTYNTVDLWWTANTESDLVGYKVCQDGSPIGTTANTYYNVTGLSPSTTYEFNVSAYDDNGLEGEPATVMVTTPGYPAPTIIDWYNNKTGSSLSVTISESECVYFNATADQTIGVWSWFVDGADQGNNLDEFTYCWGEGSEHFVAVNATNANGTSGTIEWTVNVGIEDTEAPVVADPSANPATILNDNGRPRPPGTNISQLNVTVTDAGSGVSTVTIDLSPIGGSATQDMTNIGGNVWSVETNATIGVNLTHNLVVNATDNAGYSNISVSITLTVLRRGDIVRDNVVDTDDALYILRSSVGLEPEPSMLVADVQPAEGDNLIDTDDALYILRYTVGLEDEP